MSPERLRYRELWERDDPALLTILEEELKTGEFRGIGEISVSHFPSAGFPEADYSPISPTMKGIMGLAGRYKVPVLVHCEVTRIREFSQLLDEFPEVQVIWAHGGYTPLVLARRMLEKHPNLYYELSARTWERHPRSPEYSIIRADGEVAPEWLALIEEYSERCLVGTDASGHDPDRERRKIASVQRVLSQLTPGTRSNVASQTLSRLLSNR